MTNISSVVAVSIVNTINYALKQFINNLRFCSSIPYLYALDTFITMSAKNEINNPVYIIWHMKNF